MAAISETPEHRTLPNQAPPSFWETMSEELFKNVYSLYEQIDAYLPLRSREEGFPPIIVFCAYICGSLASYLWKTPQRKNLSRSMVLPTSADWKQQSASSFLDPRKRSSSAVLRRSLNCRMLGRWPRDGRRLYANLLCPSLIQLPFHLRYPELRIQP